MYVYGNKLTNIIIRVFFFVEEYKHLFFIEEYECSIFKYLKGKEDLNPLFSHLLMGTQKHCIMFKTTFDVQSPMFSVRKFCNLVLLSLASSRKFRGPVHYFFGYNLKKGVDRRVGRYGHYWNQYVEQFVKYLGRSVTITK